MMELVPWAALAVSTLTLAYGVFDRVVNAGRDKQRLSAVETAVTTQAAQNFLFRDELKAFQIEVAKTYIPAQELADIRTELFKRFDRLEQRLDGLFGAKPIT